MRSTTTIASVPRRAATAATSALAAGALLFGAAATAGADTLIDNSPEPIEGAKLPIVHVSEGSTEADASCVPGAYRTEITSLTRTYRHVGTSRTDNRTDQSMTVKARYSTNDVVEEKVTGDLGEQWSQVRPLVSEQLNGELQEKLEFAAGAESGPYTLPAKHRGLVDYGYAMVNAKGTQQRCTLLGTWGWSHSFSAVAPWKRVAMVTVTNSLTGEVARPEAINPSGGTERPGETDGYIDTDSPSIPGILPSTPENTPEAPDSPDSSEPATPESAS